MELFVNEIYVKYEGWKKVNSNIKVEKLFLMLRNNEIESFNAKTKKYQIIGRDYNLYSFFIDYKKEILEGMVKLAERQIKEKFENFRVRRCHLTSYSGIDWVDIINYKEGIYFTIDASCHTSIKFFMNNNGIVTRKPTDKKLTLIEKINSISVNC